MKRAYGLVMLLLLCACAAPPPRPAAPPPRDVVVLLPDDQGKTGSVVVTGAGTERVLSKPGQAVAVSKGSAPGEPFVLSDSELAAMAGPALRALPPPPAQFIFYFNLGESELTDESRARLRDAARTIRERFPVDVSVVGHTDTVGDKRYNYQLSLKRARSVAALLSAEGVDPAIMEITSHGKDNPLVPTGDQVPEPRNRRVEVTVR